MTQPRILITISDIIFEAIGKLTVVQWRHMVSSILVIIGSENVLSLLGVKYLPEQMLINYKLGNLFQWNFIGNLKSSFKCISKSRLYSGGHFATS